MSALIWQRGTLYPTGSVVRPTSSEAAGAGPPLALLNADFELGFTGWTPSGSFLISADAPNSFSGTQHARLNGPSVNSAIRNNTIFPVTPGQEVRASCMIRVNAADQVGGSVAIVWRNAAGADIIAAEGTGINVLSSGYQRSSVRAFAPAGAASFQIAAFAYALQSGTLRVDAFVLEYQSPATTNALVYRAVQPAVGTSAATEPVWPATVGLTVVDGSVTWEAFNASLVAWRASPIMLTGSTEPTWPTVPGVSVTDGSGIAWVCAGRQVKDSRCPQSKVVAIGATKVFAADGDVVRYSASGNPLNWSEPDDAGFLPTGLQQNGANQIDVLNLYRSNLVALNSSTFQMWQIDPDPEQMALLDTMEGIGSMAQKAAQPVANDLFFLTALGVRTVGIAAGSTNLKAGDVGQPIDPIVQAAVAASPTASLACYYPAAGQYWLIASDVQPVAGGEGGNSWVGDGSPGGVSDGGGASGGATAGVIITYPTPAVAQRGQPYSLQLTASGGQEPYVWSTNGGEPPGLTINPSTGLVSGSPTLGGGYFGGYRATDANNLVGFVPIEIFVNAPEGAAIALNNPNFATASNWTKVAELATPGFSYQSGPGRGGANGFLRWQATAGLPNNYWGDVISNSRVAETSGNEIEVQVWVRCTAIGAASASAYADILVGVQFFEDAACTILLPGSMPNGIVAPGSRRITGTLDWFPLSSRFRPLREGLFCRFAIQCRSGVDVTMDFDDATWNVKVRVP